MIIDESSLMASVNPLIIILALFVYIFTAFLCARRYSGTNDFAKSLRLYIPAMLIGDVVFLRWGLPIILLLGIDIVGFIALALVSNHYFYHS